MFGWRRAMESSASRANSWTYSGARASCGSSRLMATSVPAHGPSSVRARTTSAMPPLPSGARIS